MSSSRREKLMLFQKKRKEYQHNQALNLKLEKHKHVHDTLIGKLNRAMEQDNTPNNNHHDGINGNTMHPVHKRKVNESSRENISNVKKTTHAAMNVMRVKANAIARKSKSGSSNNGTTTNSRSSALNSKMAMVKGITVGGNKSAKTKSNARSSKETTNVVLPTAKTKGFTTKTAVSMKTTKVADRSEQENLVLTSLNAKVQEAVLIAKVQSYSPDIF